MRKRENSLRRSARSPANTGIDSTWPSTGSGCGNAAGWAALALILFVLPGRAWAQDGWYMEMQLGAAAAPEMNVKTGGLDDWSSSDASSVRCDVTLNPDRVQVEPGVCSDVPLPWGPLEESFDGGAGILAGMVLGYRLRSLSVEGEYVYRSTAHDDTAVPYGPAASYDPSRDAAFDIGPGCP